MLLSMVLSACATTTPTIQSEAGDTIVIRAGTGDGGAGLTPHQQIIQNFEDENPNVIVQLEPVSGRDYYARLLTQLSAKAAPDIMQIGDDAVPSFVTKECFRPSGYLPDRIAILTPASTCPGCWIPARSMANSISSLKTIHRWQCITTRSFLMQASVPYPVDGWTWDDFLATAQKLTVKDSSGNVDPVGNPAAGCLDDRL